MNSTARGDIWQRGRYEQIRAIHRAFTRICSDPEQPKIRTRHPNAIEREVTTTPTDRYTNTPERPRTSRLPSEVDPTLAAVLKWEASVQQATTRIADAIDQIARITHTISTRPNLPQIPTPPAAPKTRVTNSGNLQVDIAVPGCITYEKAAIAWLQHATTALADLIRTDTDSQGETAKTTTILTRTSTLLGVRLCRCEDRCGLPAPDRGRGATRPACRKRNERKRKKQPRA